MNSVTRDKVVSLRYCMYNGRGEMLENTLQSTPTSYLHGAAGILPLLQAQLEDLKAGDRKWVDLARQEGLTEDNFRFEVIIDAVRDALPEELLLGYPVLPPPAACEEECPCYEKDTIGTEGTR